PLPDPVRPAAEDHHLLAVGNLRLVLRLAKQRRLIGRVEIGRRRVELRGAAVDALEHRTNTEPQPVGAHLWLSDPAGHARYRAVHDPAATRGDCLAHAA